MEYKGKHMILVLITTLIVGTIVSSIFHVRGTAEDVGYSGAFFLHLIFNFIYSALISLSSLFFMLFSKEYNFNIVLFSASIIMCISKIEYIYYSFIYQGFLYIVGTYFLTVILSLIYNKKNREKNNVQI